MSVKKLYITPPFSPVGDFHLGQALSVVSLDVLVRYEALQAKEKGEETEIVFLHDNWNVVHSSIDKKISKMCSNRESLMSETRKNIDLRVQKSRESKSKLGILPSGHLIIDTNGEIKVIDETIELRDDDPLFVNYVSEKIKELGQRGFIRISDFKGEPQLYLQIKPELVDEVKILLDNLTLFPERFKADIESTLRGYDEECVITKPRIYSQEINFSGLNEQTGLEVNAVSPLIISHFAGDYILERMGITNNEVGVVTSNASTGRISLNMMRLLFQKALNMNSYYDTLLLYGKVKIPEELEKKEIPLKYYTKEYQDQTRYITLMNFKSVDGVFNRANLKEFFKWEDKIRSLYAMASELESLSSTGSLFSKNWERRIKKSIDELDLRTALLIIKSESEKAYSRIQNQDSIPLNASIELEKFRNYLALFCPKLGNDLKKGEYYAK